MKLYYNEVMKYFGEQFLSNWDFFERVSREEAIEADEVFWFGIYDEEDFKAIMKTTGNVYLHWCGTDIVWCMQKGFMESLNEKENISFSADSNQILHEATNFFGSRRVRFAPLYSGGVDNIKPKGLSKFKKRTHVVVYQPGREIYMPEKMIELANKNKHITYHWVGDKNGIFTELPKNIINHGYLSHQETLNLIEQCHAMVRWTFHDGLPNMVIESILLGTPVIANHLHPMTYSAKTLDEIIDAIKISKKDKPPVAPAWWYRNSDMINNWDKLFYKRNYPTVDIVIVESGRNREWFKQALDSAKYQMYPFCNILVIDNTDKSLGVGEAYNKAADESTADYVYYLGDDDYISPDLILNLVEAIFRSEDFIYGIVNSNQYVSYVNENGVLVAQGRNIPTGLWLRKWIVENRFDEKLKKLIDTELLDRVDKLNFSKICLPYHYGYFYRQHDNMISGNKIKNTSEISKVDKGRISDAI